MKKNDFSQIRTLEELKLARFQTDFLLEQSRKTLSVHWRQIHSLFTLNNMVFSIASEVTGLLTQTEMFRKGFSWILSLFGENNDSEVNK